MIMEHLLEMGQSYAEGMSKFMSDIHHLSYEQLLRATSDQDQDQVEVFDTGFKEWYESQETNDRLSEQSPPKQTFNNVMFQDFLLSNETPEKYFADLTQSDIRFDEIQRRLRSKMSATDSHNTEDGSAN